MKKKYVLFEKVTTNYIKKYMKNSGIYDYHLHLVNEKQ